LAIEFSILDDKRVIVITIDGDVTARQLDEMRQRTVQLIEETGYTDFIVDLRNLKSLERGKVVSIVELGEKYSDSHITVWSNTAILMPSDEAAYEQADLMHTIEINRGRGVMSYVESTDEAFSWFEDMATRT